MPRLGAITDEISEDLEHALAVCTELGIRDVELRSVWGKSIVDHEPDDIAKIKSLLRGGGFSVCAIASPFLKCQIAGDTEAAQGNTHSAGSTPRSGQAAVLERTMHVAKELEAPIVRAFTFWRVDDPESVREDILGELQRATDIVEAAGLLLGLENEHACNVATGAESAWFLDRIPNRTLGLIWDPGNEAALGSNPIPDGYEAVKDRIHHVHLKDPVAIDAEHVAFTEIGTGALDYVAQFQLLARDRYDGILSIESHFAIDGSKEAGTRLNAAGIRRVAAEAGLDLE